LPSRWESAGLPDFDGVVWFSREFELPASWQGKNVTLSLGPIDDRDTTFVNGNRVGGLESWLEPRVYKVPARYLQPGKNRITVRVLDTGGGGGIGVDAEAMNLKAEGASDVVSLAGTWRYQVGIPLAKVGSPPPSTASNDPNVVTVLYNGMIAPLLPFAIKGAIWYQGESNAGRGRQYQTLLPTMIRDWRDRFGVGEFPFFIVQLANFMDSKPEPGESSWAELREAQSLTARNVPKTGVAVAIDIGDAKDIHPKNKQEVGRRLALNALATAYGKKLEFSGPVYDSMKMDGGKIRLKFKHTTGGLKSKGAKLEGFSIAGDDKKFVWADAVIEGDYVIVSSPRITKPAAVRYAWADNPLCNLYNGEGLPASPFRTDK
jgi:sialate O-acetylesterase